MADSIEKSIKKPINIRLSDETAEKIREISKEFSNQDAAMNALLSAFEREKLVDENPMYAEDIKQFAQYLSMLNSKFSEVMSALSTSDQRARAEVQSLLSSKDLSIQNLQEQMTAMKEGKEQSDARLMENLEQMKLLEEEIEKDRLALQGMESQIKQKELQFAATLSDKDKLNEILTNNVKEKQDEVDRLKKHSEENASLRKKVDELDNKLREAEQALKEAALHEQQVLLEREKQSEKEKEALRKELEEKAAKQQAKADREIEKLRELLLSQAQERLGGSGKKKSDS